MLHRISSAMRGMTVLDAYGRAAGTVQATYPLDGGSPEFAIVRMGRFGRRVLVPLELTVRVGAELQTPFRRSQLEEAPSMDASRYLDDAVSRTRGYWATVDLDEESALPYTPLQHA